MTTATFPTVADVSSLLEDEGYRSRLIGAYPIRNTLPMATAADLLPLAGLLWLDEQGRCTPCVVFRGLDLEQHQSGCGQVISYDPRAHISICWKPGTPWFDRPPVVCRKTLAELGIGSMVISSNREPQFPCTYLAFTV